ncbi:MAG: hypothetical protein ACLQNG_19155 [Acidimicrobiales bacterium]
MVTVSMLAGLLDDAALFPPGNAEMRRAVPDHRRYGASWYGRLVGPFVIPDARLEELAPEVGEGPAGSSFELSVIVTGGLDALESTLEATGVGWRMAGVEIPLGGHEGAPERARRAVRLLQQRRGIHAFVEVPPGREHEDVLDALEGTGIDAKLRTGGLVAEAFPADRDVARFLVACVERRIAFKCTAGLHAAVRHRSADEGFERQGFVNLILASHAALHRSTVSEVTAFLAEQDEATVVGALQALGDEALAETRQCFRSFGTCSVEEPVVDLLRLGLLEAPAPQEPGST